MDNPVLGSKRLNRAGLHRWRIAGRALACLAPASPSRSPDPRRPEAAIRSRRLYRHPELPVRRAFPQTPVGIARKRTGEPRTSAGRHDYAASCRVGPKLLSALPDLDRMLDSPRWKGIMAYVASSRIAPLYYVQTIVGGCTDAAARSPDPAARRYVPPVDEGLAVPDRRRAGRSPADLCRGLPSTVGERAEWEHRKSINVATDGDRLSQRGSFRIMPEELAELNLPKPTHFAVPANTLVAADTCGFHARANSDRMTVRVELWAYARRSPFIPWTGLDLLSWRPIAIRRAEWLARSLTGRPSVDG